ncbi:MAG: hypothetical protein B6242_00635 [Anaerolineaceae bacterium 4572_78]|nr:MAG: hypothetical protein B6242_00635 [Anaerolineaceae bacterium 4572_78]
MAYSDFSLEKVKHQFNLVQKTIDLFPDETSIHPSDWLKQTLSMGLDLTVISSSEKARGELLVMPILLELRHHNNNSFAIYSGTTLDADNQQGLNGECDFVLTIGEVAHAITTPIFSLVETKKKDIDGYFGQCVAQMMGARFYNQQQGNNITTIYGCITTGDDWQFLKLEDDTIFIDRKYYALHPVERLLGVLQRVVETYL